MSEQVEGILLAIGASIPEFSTNLIASLSNSVDIGIGAIAGSGSYDFTICFGFASLFTLGMKLHPGLYYRDSIVYLLTLGLLTYFLIDQKIQVYEAATLTCLWPIYVVISMYKSNSTESISADFNLHSNNNEDNDKQIADAVLNIPKESMNLGSTSFSSLGLIQKSQRKESMNDDEGLNLIHLGAEKGEQRNQSEKVSSIKKNTVYNCIERLYEKTGAIYAKYIPLWDNSPIISFLIIMVLIILHSNLIVFTIQNVSDRLNISETFLGMTIISWGGNIGDTITACVAAKINASALISTSILGSQITNLQLCLGFPWLCAMIKRHLQGESIIAISFGSLGSENQSNPLYYFVPLLICVLLSMLIFAVFRMKLNKFSGGLLSLVYICYFAYEAYIQAI